MRIVQIGMGLVPAVIVVMIILCRRRAWNRKRAVFLLLLIMACAFSFIIGIWQIKNSAIIINKVSKSDMLSLSYAFMDAGEYDLAEQILDEYIDYGIYDGDISIAKARLEALKGNYQVAFGIANRDDISYNKQEKQMLFTIMQAEAYDEEMYTYALSVGTEISYNQEMINKANTYKAGSFSQCICDNIKRGSYFLEDTKIVEVLKKVNEEYQLFLESDDYNSAEAETLFQLIEEIVLKNRTLEKIHLVRELRLKAAILARRYEKIAKYLDKTSSYEEYMIVSELFMNGYIGRRDFKEEFCRYSVKDMEAVTGQLEKIKKRQKKKLTSSEYENLCQKIDNIKEKYKDPIVGTLISELERKIEEEEVDGNEAKVYLQIGKMNSYMGDEKQARNNISQAMDSIGSCTDSDFAVPMLELISISEGKAGENVKNVSEYVDRVMENTMPIRNDKREDETDIQNQGEINETKEEKMEFSNQMQEYILESASAITISHINTAEFETVKAKLTFSSDFSSDHVLQKEDIDVRDCGIDIEDFALEKIEYTEAQILLCCDNSDSMKKNIDILKAAVSSFVNGRAENENISLLTFNSGILGRVGFGSNDEQLKKMIDAMSARGGTDIYNTVLKSIQSFQSGEKVNKNMIVMTDGMDNEKADLDEIYDNIGRLAEQKGITVYTIGLGNEVDIDYLTAIAESTGGSFIYSPSGNELESFYRFIGNKMNHQYNLTYHAIDTMTMIDRELQVSLAKNSSIHGEKKYNLKVEEDSKFSTNNGICIYGLSPKMIYQSQEEQEVKLSGTGFKKEMNLTVKLIGNVSYEINTEYIDEKNIRLKLPVGLLADTYDVEIRIDGRSIYLQNEFTVINPGSEDVLDFGPYHFVAANISDTGSGYELIGNVTMNEWLHFRGRIRLEGRITGEVLTLIDNQGAYVEYNQSTAEGLGKALAKQGVNVNLSGLGSVNLYKNPELAKAVEILSVKMYTALNLPRVDMKLLPEQVQLSFHMASTMLPFQQNLLTTNENVSPFDFEFDAKCEGVITGKNIGIKIDTTWSKKSSEDSEKESGKKENNENNSSVDEKKESDTKSDSQKESSNTVSEVEKTENNNTKKQKKYKSGNFSNSPIYIDFNNSAVKIDTLENDYYLKFSVKMKDLFGIEGVMVELAWEEQQLNEVKLGIDAKVTTYIANVPVTFSNFSLKAILPERELLTVEKLLQTTLEGKLDVEMLNVKEVFPKISKYFSEDTQKLCVLSMPETTFSVNLGKIFFEFDASLWFMKKAKIAETTVKLGNFRFQNELLQADEDTKGLFASMKVGPVWETENWRVEATCEGASNAHARFVGVEAEGVLSASFKLWIFEVKTEKEAEAVVGIRLPKGEKARLVFAFKYEEDGEKKSKMLYIDQDGNLSDKSDYL